MKWLLLILLLVLVYQANYYRLKFSPPKRNDEVKAIDANTTHSLGKLEFIPHKIDTNCTFTRITDQVPYMGEHWICLSRLFAPFNPDKPTGEMKWDGKVVGYFYSSDKPVNDYHWHLHKNFCLREGLQPTTEYSPFQCILHGWYWWPFNKYMVHVWLNNPDGVNELWNSNLH